MIQIYNNYMKNKGRMSENLRFYITKGNNELKY